MVTRGKEPLGDAASARAEDGRMKNGAIAIVLALKVLASMSVWLPESSRLTRPGLGQVSSSASNAVTAAAAT